MSIFKIEPTGPFKDVQLSRNFWLHEFRCKGGDWCCGGVAAINRYHLIPFIQAVRTEFGSELLCVNTLIPSAGSGFRCIRWNIEIDGSDNSDHTKGNAADMFAKNGDYAGFERVVKRLVKNFPKAYALYYPDKKFIHMGVRY